MVVTPVVMLASVLGAQLSVTFGITTTKLRLTNTVPFLADGNQSLMPPIPPLISHKLTMLSFPSTEQ
jgi:hypothetical protein